MFGLEFTQLKILFFTRYIPLIFSKYLTNSNFSLRVRPASIRHLFPRQGNPLPIKLLTLFNLYLLNVLEERCFEYLMFFTEYLVDTLSCQWGFFLE
jgi:hypothetical protein